MSNTLTSDPMVDRLLQERDSLERRVDSMKQVANEQDRLLNDDEKTAVQAAKDRVARLDEQLDLIGDTLAMSDESRSRLARVTRSVVATPPGYNRAGEVLYDILHASDGASATRLQAAMNRAAEHMGTEKTTTVATAGDLGGLVVTPVVGAVIDPYPSGMPFANALGLTESPSAMHFMRPRIVDTSFASGVGTQSLEKAELVSKAFEVTADPITLATVGGYLNVSQQLISLQPGSLDLIISHMLKRLAAKIDGMLITEMALSTGKVTLSLTADAAATLKAIYDASAAVYAATGELAQWIAMGPTGYARLGSLVDAAGRPLFPTIGPANAPGTASAAQFSSTVAGLRVVVTPGITDATFWVGNGDVLEGYLYRFPVLEAVEPSVLGRQVAVAAAAAAYRPIPNGAIHLAP